MINKKIKIFLLTLLSLFSLVCLENCSNDGGEPEGVCLVSQHGDLRFHFMRTLTYEYDDPEIYYSLDGKTDWKRIDINRYEDYSQFTEYTFPTCQNVYIVNRSNYLSSQNGYVCIVIDAGVVSASGDILSLINHAPIHDHCFYYLFSGSTSLVDVSNLILPDTTAPFCYSQMFALTNIMASPFLPAKAEDLTERCYDSMFFCCFRLKKVYVNFGVDNKWPDNTLIATLSWLYLVNNDNDHYFYWQGDNNYSGEEVRDDPSVILAKFIPTKWSVRHLIK